MKHLFLSMLLFLTQVNYAQTKSKKDNAILQQLFIFNSNNEVLVIKQQGSWTTPELRYDGNQSVKQALDSLALLYGITISDLSLRGQFNFKDETTSASSLHHQYVANLKAGNLISPKATEESKWVPVDKALAIISSPVLQVLLSQIRTYPQTVWGGTFSISTKNGQIDSKIVEPFYPLFQSSGLPEVYSPLIQLTILNDKNEILMRKTEYGWMTVAQRFYSKQNMHEVVASMAAKYGIKISEPTLAGLFTYKYTFKNNADTRQFYVAHYLEGKIVSPAGEEVMWLSKQEAIEKLTSTVESLGTTTNQVLTYPETLWGGSFLLSRVDGKLKSEVDEAFYPLITQQQKK